MFYISLGEPPTLQGLGTCHADYGGSFSLTWAAGTVTLLVAGVRFY